MEIKNRAIFALGNTEIDGTAAGAIQVIPWILLLVGIILVVILMSHLFLALALPTWASSLFWAMFSAIPGLVDSHMKSVKASPSWPLNIENLTINNYGTITNNQCTHSCSK